MIVRPPGKGGQEFKKARSMANKNKKYETPQVEVVNLETAPLLAGSGTVSAEGAKWNGLDEDGDE